MMRKNIFHVSNVAIIRRHWHKYNEIVFDGKLREPIFFVYRSGHYGTYDCETGRSRIGIGFSFGLYEMFRDALLHEMCHQYEAEVLMGFDAFNDGELEHGKEFLEAVALVKEKLDLDLLPTWKRVGRWKSYMRAATKKLA